MPILINPFRLVAAQIKHGHIRGIRTASITMQSHIASFDGRHSCNCVSRTGYDESDVVNNNTVNVKLSGGIYYMTHRRIEASLVGYWGTGNTVYTGSDRYSLKDLKIGQYKLEFKHKDWFLRAYTTQENAGESYNATITTRRLTKHGNPVLNFANLPG